MDKSHASKCWKTALRFRGQLAPDGEPYSLEPAGVSGRKKGRAPVESRGSDPHVVGYAMSHRILVFYGSYRSDRMGIRLAQFVVDGLRDRGGDLELTHAKAA